MDRDSLYPCSSKASHQKLKPLPQDCLNQEATLKEVKAIGITHESF